MLIWKFTQGNWILDGENKVVFKIHFKTFFQCEVFLNLKNGIVVGSIYLIFKVC
jgi:hypothetical protein